MVQRGGDAPGLGRPGPDGRVVGANPTPPPDGLKGMAIYCLHGEKDSNTPAERSRLAVEAMKKIGQKVRVLANLDNMKTPSDATMIYREVPGLSTTLCSLGPRRGPRNWVG